MNVIANNIFQINSELLPKKNRTNENKFHLSCLVEGSFEKSNLIDDYEAILNMKNLIE